jgi:hypothetical protein
MKQYPSRRNPLLGAGRRAHVEHLLDARNIFCGDDGRLLGVFTSDNAAQVFDPVTDFDLELARPPGGLLDFGRHRAANTLIIRGLGLGDSLVQLRDLLGLLPTDAE